jgi:FkbM family methyltransferase
MMAIQYSCVAERVTCFEPAPGVAELAAHNLALNGAAHNCTLYQAALADAPGAGRLRCYHGNNGRRHLVRPGATTTRGTIVPVPVATLDGFGFDDVDGVKVDVEGAELLVLRGAAQTIARCRPVVQVELIEGACRGFGSHPQEVFEWFAARGYEALDRGGGRLGASWTYVRHRSDVFFMPRERRGGLGSAGHY